MLDLLREYFTFTSNRTPEGFLSWQHIMYVTVSIGIACFFAIYFGLKRKNKEMKIAVYPLKVAAIVMLSLELWKWIMLIWTHHSFSALLNCLPLFLCSINLIFLPIAAFAKGRIQKVCLDFVFIFGVVCGVAGTYLASNYFGSSPIFSFFVMNSVATHVISLYSSVYIGVCGLNTMKKENIKYVLLSLAIFEVLAYVADLILESTSFESNYMFLLRSAGTPFTIVETIAGGNSVIYTLIVATLYFIIPGLYYLGFYLYKKLKKK